MAEAAPSWSEVEARYDDPAAHDAFLAACRESGALVHAASCYRAVLAKRPDDPIAERRLKQIVALVMLSMNLDSARRQSTEPARLEPGRRLRASIGSGAAGAVVGGLVAIVFGKAEGPSAHSGLCEGLLRGSPICLVPLPSARVLLYAFFGALAGMAIHSVFARVRPRA